MARAQNTDFFHDHKFHVSATASSVFPAAEGGFNTVSLPEMTVEEQEYKEGIFVYKRKYPGNPTISNTMLTRGVAEKRTNFYQWCSGVIHGNEYRTDITIWHQHRDDTASAGDKDVLESPASKRRIILRDSWCSRYKPGSDMDANSGAVSIEECEIVVEAFHIELPDFTGDELAQALGRAGTL